MSDSSNSKLGIETILLGVIAIILLVQTISMFGGDDEKKARIEAARNTAPATQPAMQTQQPATQAPVTMPGQDAGPTTSMTFSETEVDLGSVQQGERKTHTFTVNNAGTNPLVLQSVSGDGGLSIDDYPVNEIPPGGSGEIKVTFTADQAGQASKIVHINANTNPEHTHLTFNANVQ